MRDIFFAVGILVIVSTWCFKVWNERDWKMMVVNEQSNQSATLERIAKAIEKAKK